ncbi:MAG: YbjQ family protein [Acidobacteria bacterium]|nr:YbjQ family protein [Acidobacteriota bacterium]
MLITTQDQFEDFEIEKTLGLVRGNTIRARHIGKDILAGLRTLVGGEIVEYTKMLAESREQAIDRMISEAKRRGADGIVCVRFTTSAVMQGAAELLAYGTAVRLRQKT